MLRTKDVAWAVANAQATQFVLPALFSLTYPLDHGGYNSGIRHRPRSYAEQLADAGYSTQMMASCNVLGITHGYDRGFSEMHTAMDARAVLAHLIGRNLLYELKNGSVENFLTHSLKNYLKMNLYHFWRKWPILSKMDAA